MLDIHEKQIVEDLKKLLNITSEKTLKESLASVKVTENLRGVFLSFRGTNKYHILKPTISSAMVLTDNALDYPDLAGKITELSKLFSKRSSDEIESFCIFLEQELRSFFCDIVSRL